MPKGSILVVDDEIEIREGLEALLTSENFQVTLAETGAAGLQKLEDNPFDLMLLDVSLPDRNGLELLREIRRRDPQLSIILITAFGSIDMARAAFKGGAQDFITGWLAPGETKHGRWMGRPVGIAFGSDGSMYLSDDSAGVIYRITYSK